MKRSISLLLLLMLVLTISTAQTTEKKQYTTSRISKAPVIDGILDDEVWKDGAWTDDFMQYEPKNGKPTSQKTEFKIVYDNDNIYAAFKAYDTAPDSIVNRLTRRDDPDGDLVGVIFDSFHDLRTGFLFGISSSGVKYDQMFTNDGQNQDSSWDPNWWVKTSINKEGWVAEMKIPFSQLRFDKDSSGIWGLEVARVLYRKNETDFWQHIPKDAPGIVHMFGEMKGLENIKPRKIFDVTPYGVAKAETFKKEEGNPFLSKGNKFGLNAGVDAKIGVTNNMTLDLTINPDFGQVEADPSVVNLTAYETYFSEKRPFFIEGNNITNFNLGIGDGSNGNDNLFYSRRIGRRPQGELDLHDGWHADVPTSTAILGAAKLTGKTSKGLSVGFVDAMTSQEMAEIDTVGGKKLQSVEPFTNYFIGRVQKDLKEGNTLIGGILTSTTRVFNTDLATMNSSLEETMHKTAYTGGIDFTQYFKKKSWMFSLNTAFSQVNGTKEAIALTQQSSARYYQRPDNDYVKYDPNRTSLFGSGGRMQIQKLNGHLNVLGCVIWKTPGFETNDLGYMQQADNVLSVLWVGWHEWEPKGIYQRYNIGGDLVLVNDFGGDIIAKQIEFNPSITFKNFWQAWGYANLSSTILSTDQLRGGPMMKLPGSTQLNFGFSSDYRKKLNVNVYENFNIGFQKSSRYFNIGTNVTYKPFNYLNFTISPGFSKSSNDLQYVTHESFNGSDRYIFASIKRTTINSSFRLNFNLTPDLTLQYWGQPYIASGKYSDYKYITNPLASEYHDRYHAYTASEISYDGSNYNIDDDHNGTVDYSVGDNNFNYQFFLSNLVIRWEYSPGSTVYLVWSQSRDNYNGTGQMDFINNMGDLFNRKNDVPHNVFLVKFSYRFGLK
jgi:hypothetical protein